jgi:cell volume regulation protein A
MERSSMASEPLATALVLLAVGVLLLASVAASRFARRSGVPVVLLFLLLGMVAGSEGLGGIQFHDYALAYRVGTLALVLILFDGGMRTPLASLRRATAAATALATVGVVITAALVGAVAHALGFGWTEGLLLGAIVAPTDAAAVFSVLRGGGVHLEERVAAVVELESGLNDPTAVLLTVALTRALATGHPLRPVLPAIVLAELVIGAVLGVAIGLAARFLLAHVRVQASGLYPLITISVACIAYGGASLLLGSGFLAVYAAAVVLGNSRVPYPGALFRVHDFVAWASQIGMFLALGLLVLPSHLVAVAPMGLAIALFLAFVARPVAVFACTLPFRPRLREVALVSWIGLRGAVPITLAVIPILAGLAGAHRIFDVVFFVVLVSALLQGSTARWLARRLGLAGVEEPAPEAVLEIGSTRPLDAELMAFRIVRSAAVCGVRVADIPFPEGASMMLLVRGESLLAPRGDTVLEADDHVYVFCRREDAGLLRLLFGRTEGEE